MFTALEQKMMARALALAALARGKTSPNPLVGAVVLKGSRVVGEGCHRACGAAHAEVAALRKAGEAARGATLVVTLEPCAHYGRTPPCVDRIIRAGVARVVAAMRDPHPLVRGKGIQRLREAGIEVEVGLMAAEARKLNEVFVHRVTTGLPFAALKLAQSLDGKIAARAGSPTRITSLKSRRLVHKLRSWYDSVLVGVSTVAADDPLLNVRGLKNASQPVRVVIDPSLRIPPHSRLVGTARSFETLVLCDRARAGLKRQAALEKKGVRVLALDSGGETLLPGREILAALAREGLTSVLIEGGGLVATHFLRERLVQRLHLFVAPVILGEGEALQGIGNISTQGHLGTLRLKGLEKEFIGPDAYYTGRIVYPPR